MFSVLLIHCNETGGFHSAVKVEAASAADALAALADELGALVRNVRPGRVTLTQGLGYVSAGTARRES